MEVIFLNIGEKIKAIRIKNDLTQEELADRCELTKGFISQVERDLTSPSVATLIDILDGLGTNLKDFFSDSIDEQIVFSKDDFFETKNEDLNYKIQWVVPNAQKNSMEPMLIEIAPGGKTKLDSPHEGEEFGYILNGIANLYLGDKEYKLKKGESFYYKANSNHYISNTGKAKTNIIWVSTPPSF